MDLRGDELAQWAVAKIHQLAHFEVTAKMEIVSGDASFRRYFRLHCLNKSWIAVDAPPEKEDNPRFVRIAKAWHDQGIAVPKVIAFDFEQGFLLLEDFGDTLLWAALHQETAQPEHLYTLAIDELCTIQSLPTEGLPAYDSALLQQEMQLFRDWLCDKLLVLELSSAERQLLDEVFARLEARALAQPKAVVHRDYHSRNLMLRQGGLLGVIDFQDAVVGPVTYDLVSLLRDCYVSWPISMVDELSAYYWEKARPLGLYLSNWETFRQDFDFMGLQRHLKAAGIFARLHLRDGKSGYLKDIPNTCQYLLEISARYAELADFQQWLRERFMPALSRLPDARNQERDSSAE